MTHVWDSCGDMFYHEDEKVHVDIYWTESFPPNYCPICGDKYVHPTA